MIQRYAGYQVWRSKPDLYVRTVTEFSLQASTGPGRYFKENTTVEGKFTAQAALTKADKLGLDVPIIRSVSDLVP